MVSLHDRWAVRWCANAQQAVTYRAARSRPWHLLLPVARSSTCMPGPPRREPR